MMRLYILVAVLCLGVAGCSSKGEVALKDNSVFALKNPKIIERDLTIPHNKQAAISTPIPAAGGGQ